MAKKTLRRLSGNSPKWHELRDAAADSPLLQPRKAGTYEKTARTPAGAPPPVATAPTTEAATAKDPNLAPKPGHTRDVATPRIRSTISIKGGETVPIRATVRAPARGYSAFFDKVSAKHGDQTALRMILRAALSAFDTALQSGTVTDEPPGYTLGDGRIKVTRAMSHNGQEAARKLLDPFELMGTEQLGTQICRAALSFYLSQQPGSPDS